MLFHRRHRVRSTEARGVNPAMAGELLDGRAHPVLPATAHVEVRPACCRFRTAGQTRLDERSDESETSAGPASSSPAAPSVHTGFGRAIIGFGLADFAV